MVAALMSVPQARAQERNLVAFGDSVLADPGIGIYLVDRMSSFGGSSGSSGSSLADGSSQVPYGANCPSSHNYAKRLGDRLGLPVHDFSCSGAVTMSDGPLVAAQVDYAISTGALNVDTQRVIFAAGFNDTYNNKTLTMEEMRARWVAATAPIIHRIRQVAPHARLQIVGYPTIGAGENYCLIHLGNNLNLDATPMPQMRFYEDAAQWMQVDLAHATGVEFVDLKGLTRDNGMCASDQDRMWSGLIDFGPYGRNLPLHLNAHGHEYIADILARR
ncbi:hydrolase [Corynebacterium phocae]|uniref:Hydrolase n=1 Tax=Corynebacterium phocae TaxID=161895 RepID=A0A1L7D690_9CORY|nr:GDSL-type esterase/lipase family protein [Corynebacterium phocae]APT93587.1 hydrolase [Corynebacterium phocae]KAA8728553.1 hydrolase [Corynebacterium phocae]